MNIHNYSFTVTWKLVEFSKQNKPVRRVCELGYSGIYTHLPVNSNTTGTITPMFSSYDWMKPNLKQKAGTARGKWLVRKDWGKLRGVKSLFLSENMLEK